MRSSCILQMNVGSITTINSFVFGSISICMNTLLMVIIYNAALKVIGVYRYMLIAATILDISLSIVYIIASPVS